MIRGFDVLLSFLGIILLLPLGLLFAFWVVLDTLESPFFIQERVGQNGKLFKLIKLKTMCNGSDLKGDLTIGNYDSRITKSGYYLRKYKIDEWPQLWNILVGQMSLVGPRPELPYFVTMYQEVQLFILKAKPGLTDEASIYYRNESQLLAELEDPEKYFVEVIIPHKIELNLLYLNNPSIGNYFRIIFKTIYVLIFQ
jgi:lipopolysaccharide/colanic/teichoic acid biosynthesis glycosyltransferase